jgi:hypothetical protein
MIGPTRIIKQKYRDSTFKTLCRNQQRWGCHQHNCDEPVNISTKIGISMLRKMRCVCLKMGYTSQMAMLMNGENDDLTQWVSGCPIWKQTRMTEA